MDQDAAIRIIQTLGSKTKDMASPAAYNAQLLKTAAVGLKTASAAMYNQLKRHVPKLLEQHGDRLARSSPSGSLNKLAAMKIVAASLLLDSTCFRTATTKSAAETIRCLEGKRITPSQIKRAAEWVEDFGIFEWGPHKEKEDIQGAEEEQKEREELSDLRKRAFQLQDDPSKEEELRAIRRRMIALTQKNQERERERSIRLAREEEERRAALLARGGPQCTGDSVDVIMQEPLLFGGAEVIDIATDMAHPDNRQCYIRDQLKQTMDAATKLYEWSDHGTSWNPGLPFKQRIYLLPQGNLAITEAGYKLLTEPNDYRHFALKSIGDKIVGAENHTASALWNRTMQVYHVLPFDKYDDAAFQFVESVMPQNAVQHAPLYQVIQQDLQEMRSLIPGEPPVLFSSFVPYARAYRWNINNSRRLASTVIERYGGERANQPITEASFSDVFPEVQPDQQMHLFKLLDSRLSLYTNVGLAMQPTDARLLADSYALQDAIEDLIEYPVPPEVFASLVNPVYTKEIAFLVKHFPNSNFLIGLMAMWAGTIVDNDVRRTARAAAINQLSPPISIQTLFEPIYNVKKTPPLLTLM